MHFLSSVWTELSDALQGRNLWPEMVANSRRQQHGRPLQLIYSLVVQVRTQDEDEGDRYEDIQAPKSKKQLSTGWRFFCPMRKALRNSVNLKHMFEVSFKLKGTTDITGRVLPRRDAFLNQWLKVFPQEQRHEGWATAKQQSWWALQIQDLSGCQR